ncbi:MAG: hypothetical protein K8F53_10570 [Rhodocyclaceae bacterium]|nr:hypothetical protein [Rhodocyclaceae bacterium]
MYCHSRGSGNPWRLRRPFWIPASAGMTKLRPRS